MVVGSDQAKPPGSTRRTRFRAGSTPGECLGPEPAQRRVVLSLEIHLNQLQRRAADSLFKG
ncbi:hypothetical protein GCM10023084_63240 [Streptomyces lacrimifluminis]